MADSTYHPSLDSHGLIGQDVPGQSTGSGEISHMCPAEKSALAAVLAAKPASTATAKAFGAAGGGASHTGLATHASTQQSPSSAKSSSFAAAAPKTSHTGLMTPMNPPPAPVGGVLGAARPMGNLSGKTQVMPPAPLNAPTPYGAALGGIGGGAAGYQGAPNWLPGRPKPTPHYQGVGGVFAGGAKPMPQPPPASSASTPFAGALNRVMGEMGGRSKPAPVSTSRYSPASTVRKNRTKIPRNY